MFGLIKKIKRYSARRTLIKNLGKTGKGMSVNMPLYVSIPQNLYLSDYIYIGPGGWISSYALVSINRGTIIGPRIKIYTANHNYDSKDSIPYDHINYAKKVTIGENVWIGGDVILLPGVTLEEGCIVGAGSVVTKSFPKGSIIGGNPARIIKYRDMEQYDRLKKEDRIYIKMKSEGFYTSPMIVQEEK